MKKTLNLSIMSGLVLMATGCVHNCGTRGAACRPYNPQPQFAPACVQSPCGPGFETYGPSGTTYAPAGSVVPTLAPGGTMMPGPAEYTTPTLN